MLSYCGTNNEIGSALCLSHTESSERVTTHECRDLSCISCRYFQGMEQLPFHLRMSILFPPSGKALKLINSHCISTIWLYDCTWCTNSCRLTNPMSQILIATLSKIVPKLSNTIAVCVYWSVGLGPMLHRNLDDLN